MNPIFVYDKVNMDIKEVALINFVEEYVLLWTNTEKARATTKRWFDDVEELESWRREG